MRTRLAALAVIASVPLLMAPPEIPCRACDGISFHDQLDTIAWHEIDVRAKVRYRVTVTDVAGAAEVELFPLGTALRSFACTRGAATRTCEVVPENRGVVGLLIEPTTDLAEVMVDVELVP